MSVCEHCKHHECTLVKITGINTGEPREDWCENDSENFMTDDGCCNYEEAKYE